MKKKLHILFASLALCFWVTVAVASPPLSFETEAQESRFNTLIEELRCLVCQNQNLADSDAELAQDLRREILGLMSNGKSNDEIKQFLVDRYGAFVLYKPQMDPSTYLLWWGPIGLLLIGALAVGFNIRKRNQQLLQDQSQSTE